jgi:hypothetical protein
VEEGKGGEGRGEGDRLEFRDRDILRFLFMVCFAEGFTVSGLGTISQLLRHQGREESQIAFSTSALDASATRDLCLRLPTHVRRKTQMGASAQRRRIRSRTGRMVAPLPARRVSALSFDHHRTSCSSTSTSTTSTSTSTVQVAQQAV